MPSERLSTFGFRFATRDLRLPRRVHQGRNWCSRVPNGMGRRCTHRMPLFFALSLCGIMHGQSAKHAACPCHTFSPASLLPTLAANRRDLNEALQLADTDAAKANVRTDGLSLFAMDEAVLAYSVYDRWERSKDETDRQVALRRLEAAVIQIDKIVQRASYMKRLKNRLNERLTKLKGHPESG